MIRILIILFFSALFFNSKAQNVKLLSVNQLEKRLSEGRDTTYIINFWATWCLPCRAELPGFEKIHEELAGQKVKIILISVDKRSKVNSAVPAFVRKFKIRNEVFVADDQKPRDYIHKIYSAWSGSIPATLIVNRSRNFRELFEQELTYAELKSAYRSLN